MARRRRADRGEARVLRNEAPGRTIPWTERPKVVETATWALALAAAVAAALLAQRVFGGAPHVCDEVAYSFQGRIFAAGRLWLPPPPVPDAFHVDNVVLTADRWCGKYPPGWPFLLALGWIVRAPWLVNPLLLGLAVAGTVRLGRALHGAAVGLAGGLLLGASPFALLLGAGRMSHVACLAASLWATLLLVEDAREASRGKAVLAGLLGGFAFLVRPYSAALVLLPAAVGWALGRLREKRPARIALPLVPALAVASAMAWIQASTWGSPFRTGYALVREESFLGIEGRTASPLDLFRAHFPAYLVDLPRAHWAIPAALFWTVLCAALFARRRRGDALLLAGVASLVLGHSLFYWAYDVMGGGPRYAFEASGHLALLAARALLVLAEGIGSFPPLAWVRGLLVPAVAAAPLVLRLPEQARGHALSYHGVLNRPLDGAREAGVGEDALVLVSVEDPSGFFGPRTAPAYHSFFLLGGADPARGRRVFARDLPGEREALLRAFPRSETWRVTVRIRPAYVGESVVMSSWVLEGTSWERLAPGPARFAALSVRGP